MSALLVLGVEGFDPDLYSDSNEDSDMTPEAYDYSGSTASSCSSMSTSSGDRATPTTAGHVLRDPAMLVGAGVAPWADPVCVAGPPPTFRPPIISDHRALGSSANPVLRGAGPPPPLFSPIVPYRALCSSAADPFSTHAPQQPPAVGAFGWRNPMPSGPIPIAILMGMMQKNRDFVNIQPIFK